VQRHVAVGQVERLPSAADLAVERAAGRDERAEVGDRVVHPEPAGAPLDEHRLVEVLRPGRIDGDERQVGGVPPTFGHHAGGHRAFGLLEHRRGERRGQAELGANSVEVDPRALGSDHHGSEP
jgi:hypothetical protein